MRNIKRSVVIAVALIVVAGAVIRYERRSGSTAPIVGIVRATEVRVEPEVAGQLTSLSVANGAEVRAGDVVARLSALELTAQADQARAALLAATANRNNVYAGVRPEQIASLNAALSKARARLEFVQSQLVRATTLERQSFETPQVLDQAENDAASARAEVTVAQANYDAAVAGPTKEERAIADAEVQAASATVAVLDRRLEKTVLRAPSDGVISVIVAEVGENVRAGQAIMMVRATGKQWLSFNVREDLLKGIEIGQTVRVMTDGANGPIDGSVTALSPLGIFATWQAERVISDHDRNTLRLRLDPQGSPAGLEPGRTVWLAD
jgi:HlyD family secretion protein